jgi:hypothetical protein
MKEEKLQALYNQFIAIRGVVDTALYLLHEELHGEAEVQQEEETAQEQCSHKDIKSFTTLGGKEHWVCRDCDFEYKEE